MCISITRRQYLTGHRSVLLSYTKVSIPFQKKKLCWRLVQGHVQLSMTETNLGKNKGRSLYFTYDINTLLKVMDRQMLTRHPLCCWRFL